MKGDLEKTRFNARAKASLRIAQATKSWEEKVATSVRLRDVMRGAKGWTASTRALAKTKA